MISFHEATKLRAGVGNVIDVYLAWRGKNYMIKMFFPSIKKPSRREVQDQVVKVYPGAKLWNYQVSKHEQGEPLLQIGGSTYQGFREENRELRKDYRYDYKDQGA